MVKYKHWRTIGQLTEEEIRTAVASVTSGRAAARLLGIHDAGASYQMLREKITNLKLDVSHFRRPLWSTRPDRNRFIPIETLLGDRKILHSPIRIARRLIDEGYREGKCHDCGLGEVWNGKPLRLRLGYLNGDQRDYRLENLVIVCPNCQSQCPTMESSKRRYETMKKNSEARKLQQMTMEELRRSRMRKPVAAE